MMKRVASHERLMIEITNLSESKDWETAKAEWQLSHIYEIEVGEKPGVCLCGHNPIIEICVLENKSNCNTAIVGNRCVKRFLGLLTKSMFVSLRRVTKDSRKTVHKGLLSLLVKHDVITDGDYQRYVKTIRKRNLSEEIERLRLNVNRLAIAFFSRKNNSPKGC